MSKLIAQVPTAVLVKGERVVIQPGQEIPAEVYQTDGADLQASKAAVPAPEAPAAAPAPAPKKPKE